MIPVRPKLHFSTNRFGAAKYTSLVAVNALKILIVAAMLLCAAVKSAVAQDIVGRIVGTVTDPSGAAVPDIKVTIVNEETQAGRDVTSDRNGYFVADELPAGTYTVAAQKVGFKKITEKGIVVTAGGRLTVDLRLEVGAISETVTVIAVGETVNTSSGEVSTTITQKQIQNLALNQRHYESAHRIGSRCGPTRLGNKSGSIDEQLQQQRGGHQWAATGWAELERRRWV